MKERSAFWDNYKGILIILVVFGHFIYEYGTGLSGSFANDLFKFIYAFHMPAFVFCSGYFSRSERSRSAPAIVKLLLYYLVFNTAMMLYYYGVQGTALKLLTPYNSYWYILSLIMWRIVIGYTSKIKGIIPIAAAATLLVGFWGEFSNILSVVRTVAFFVFFLLGYRFEETHFRRLMQFRSQIHPAFRWLFAAVSAAAVFAVTAKINLNVSILTMMPYSSSAEMILRAGIMAASAAAIFAMLIVVPAGNVPLLTKIGRNSLFIYLAHRFITLVFKEIFPISRYSSLYLIYACAATVITVLVLGGDRLNAFVADLFERMTNAVLHQSSRAAKIAVSCVLIAALVIGAVPLGSRVVRRLSAAMQAGEEITAAEAIENTAVISFVGDLILLKDQVAAGYDEASGEYDFSHMFEYVKPYLDESDLAIGVMEGPFAGEEKGYSTSNFNDARAFYLNFPDAFARAISDAGFDLLTLAGNHLLDMGVEGAMRTMDTLDAVGLAYTGGYRTQEDKDTLCLVDVEGVKLAILSYTQLVNYHTDEQMMTDLSYITSYLPPRGSEHYERVMAEIRADFAEAEASADLTVVLPHMGTQFLHEPDDFQKEWNALFSEMGADIILAAHPHTVQPIEYIGDTIVVNCPGNFTNSYITYDGDGTALVEIYINKDSKKVTAAAVIPLYNHEMAPENYRALPIYDILTKNELHTQMYDRDLERINELLPLITEIMLGKAVQSSSAQQRYYFVNGKYAPYDPPLFENTDLPLYKQMEAAETVVFIGDGVTKGSHNGGRPWYMPLQEHFGFEKVVNISEAGYTTRMAADAAAEALIGVQADLYVIAVGANDVRARRGDICAMTAAEYAAEMDALVSVILGQDPDAEILLVAPWMTQPADRYAAVPHEEKMVLIAEYTAALQTYARENGYGFSDPNAYLIPFFTQYRSEFYLRTEIYPNEVQGVDLYANAVLEGGS